MTLRWIPANEQIGKGQSVVAVLPPLVLCFEERRNNCPRIIAKHAMQNFIGLTPSSFLRLADLAIDIGLACGQFALGHHLFALHGEAALLPHREASSPSVLLR